MKTSSEIASIDNLISGLQPKAGQLRRSLFDARDYARKLELYPYDVVDVLPRPSWYQLIGIGNGFDLECGLASKYEDFRQSLT